MLVSLPIVVGNVTQLTGLGYTTIQVFCSTDLGNSFQEITASLATAAKMISLPAANTFRMGGKLLKLVFDGGTESSIYFDPLIQYWTPTQVANRINEVAIGHATVSSGSIVLASFTTGRTSNITVTYNDATDLGWSSGDFDIGEDIRISLVNGTYFYPYVDQAGVSQNQYKWRFTNNAVTKFTDFSPTVSGDAVSLISSGNLSLATATFVDVQGFPAQRTVIIAPADGTPQSVNGYALGEVATKTFVSDSTGFLAVPLVRGTKLRVAIEGTTLVREIVVPNATQFDLLSVMATAPDAFTIQTAPSLLTRRNP